MIINLDNINDYKLKTNLILILQTVYLAIKELEILPAYKDGTINSDWVEAYDFLVGSFSFNTILIEDNYQESFKKGEKYISLWDITIPELLGSLFGYDKELKIIKLAKKIKDRRGIKFTDFNNEIIFNISCQKIKEKNNNQLDLFRRK